ncbi:MAG: hypothetical protein ACPG21_13930 [Crocinitomicaceae bacterium]
MRQGLLMEIPKEPTFKIFSGRPKLKKRIGLNGFFDYPMKWNGSQLELVNYEQDTTRLEFISASDSTHQLIGDFYGTRVNWQLKKLDLETLPFFNP